MRRIDWFVWLCRFLALLPSSSESIIQRSGAFIPDCMSNMSSPTSSSSSPDVPTLKLLLVGSSSVGKSSLLLRYTDDEYLNPEEASATIGVDYKVKSITVGGKKYKLSIWDTAGQERFRTLTSSYYRGAHGVIIVYDITSRESFDALPTWFKELDVFTGSSDVVKIVVGNKVDKEYSRVVMEDEGKKFAEDHGCLFVECSAKKGVGVNGAFDDLVNKVISTPSLWQNTTGVRPGDRMPGGAPADHAATSSRGNISLGDPTGTESRDEQEETEQAKRGTENENGIIEDDEGGQAGEDDYLDLSLLTEATLPISNISRLMKKALPRQAKVSSSAKDLIQACCIEFISFLTSEANDRCLAEKRKTINGDDILFSMKSLGFDEYEIVCRIWLSRYRMALDMANRIKEKEKFVGSGDGSRIKSLSKRSLSTASAEGDQITEE